MSDWHLIRLEGVFNVIPRERHIFPWMALQIRYCKHMCFWWWWGIIKTVLLLWTCDAVKVKVENEKLNPDSRSGKKWTKYALRILLCTHVLASRHHSPVTKGSDFFLPWIRRRRKSWRQIIFHGPECDLRNYDTFTCKIAHTLPCLYHATGLNRSCLEQTVSDTDLNNWWASQSHSSTRDVTQILSPVAWLGRM